MYLEKCKEGTEGTDAVCFKFDEIETNVSVPENFARIFLLFFVWYNIIKQKTRRKQMKENKININVIKKVGIVLAILLIAIVSIIIVKSFPTEKTSNKISLIINIFCLFHYLKPYRKWFIVFLISQFL